jgi:septum formation protein
MLHWAFPLLCASLSSTTVGTTTLPLLQLLNSKALQLTLASASPRRRELMESCLGIKAENLQIMPSTFAEDLDKKSFRSAADYCSATALAKGEEVARRIESSDQKRRQVVISADTIVVHSCHDEILEKPKDAQDAHRMLSLLSGNQHTVVTAVSIFSSGSRSSPLELASSFVETTQVRFHRLSEEDIKAYIATKEPLQGWKLRNSGSRILARQVRGGLFLQRHGPPSLKTLKRARGHTQRLDQTHSALEEMTPIAVGFSKHDQLYGTLHNQNSI